MLLFDRDLGQQAHPQESPATAVGLAIWVHMEIVRIHPFQEGNGKTARLAMNVVLMRDITGPTRPVDIPVEARDRYLMCVQEARQDRPEPLAALLAELMEEMADRDEQQRSLFQRLRRRG
jgi:Fic family protein